MEADILFSEKSFQNPNENAYAFFKTETDVNGKVVILKPADFFTDIITAEAPVTFFSNPKNYLAGQELPAVILYKEKHDILNGTREVLLDKLTIHKQQEMTKGGHTMDNTNVQTQNRETPKTLGAGSASRRASYTTEQIQSARTASLADYFNRNNYECKKHGDEIHIKGFQGLWINPQKGTWYSFSMSEGGHNSIDCLQKVLGKDFQTAVGELTGEHAVTQTAKREYTPAPKESKNFVAPERADNVKRIYAYLIGRGIDKEMLSKLISEKSLYQDKFGNAVFVHKNEKGEAVGAELHGTCTYKSFQGVSEGTSGTVFQMNIGEVKKAYVFESAIDLMSFYKMADKEKLQNCALVSMGGLKPEALKPFQEKGIKILSCVDNDEAGIKFNTKHCFSASPKLAQEGVKDWNDLLQKRMNINPIAELTAQRNTAAEQTKKQIADMGKQDKVAPNAQKPTKPKRGSHH